ncbi:alpha/beta hydrolase family protein [Branchiibius hedensis]|uniref:Alpha/beta hydrolase fold n=2 Tax=Branchiibius hedensis TaxID=672460 RepID=A0A2Y8ZYH3_9MICO|nr:alpha/beta hydrolase family protein [Branchiibius hedensis]SSA36328.1 alpha/beta hydrolase fold [Branchiibius hedensis]
MTYRLSMRFSRTVLHGAVAIAAVSGLAACSSTVTVQPATTSASQTSSTASTATSSGTSSPGSADLDQYYTQKLDWQDCSGVQCAKLKVPVDYANPTSSIEIEVSKVPASGTKKGTLVVNPGGPGGSGYDYAAAADQIVSGAVRSQFDVVGFDPRGVGRSAPITCVDDTKMDTWLGSDPTPNGTDGAQELLTQSKQFADSCKAKAGPLLAHVSTIDVAKDMDILRAALGEEKLDYLGKSYGTLIGSVYAGMFPSKVGRFILDGVVPPDITSEQMNLGQAKGFEQATRSYVSNCVAGGSCPLGSDVDSGMAKIRSFLNGLDANPLPVSGNGDVTKLTEGWASYGIAEAMYSKDLWPVLTDAFKSAFEGDGNPLMDLANQYAQRNADGSYSGNLMQVINPVSCLDRGGSADLAATEKEAAEFAKQAPTWGPMLAWGSLVCGVWPYQPSKPLGKITAEGSGPILVIGTTRDPATPYAWSQQLAAELADGHLLTYDGDGHTAYFSQGSSCVDNTVDAYLINGTVPPEGKAC